MPKDGKPALATSLLSLLSGQACYHLTLQASTRHVNTTMMNAQKKTPQKPQRRLTKVLKNRLQKSLIEDISRFGGCKAVSTYSLVKFLNERAHIYGAADTLKRKAVENYFYYFNRLTKERLLAVKESLEQAPNYSDEELEESNNEDDDDDLSPQRLRSTSFTPPRRAAAPELTPRLSRLTFAPNSTMSSDQGKHVRANHC